MRTGFSFKRFSDATYEIATTNLSGGADTLLQLYGDACAAFFEEDDDSGLEPGASLISFYSFS